MQKLLEDMAMGEERIHMLSNGELRIVRIPGGFLYCSIFRFHRSGILEQTISSCFVPEEVEAANGK